MSSVQKTCTIPTFTTEKQQTISSVTLAYTMHGTLNNAKDNIVCVAHPFTATADPFVWWKGLFGDGKVFDPSHYCIICINIPGSPYGSTHPLSINPQTDSPYYYDFPVFTPRDVVQCFELLLKSLGIHAVHIAIGASMGGQVVFQWISSGDIPIERAIIIAANPKITPWMMASHHVQRNALYADPTWGQKIKHAGHEGMKIARQIGFLSYRSPVILSLFTTLSMESNPADEAGFSIAEQSINEQQKTAALRSYLEYQGDTFLQRFNAFSYHALLALMDNHDISRGHPSLGAALQAIQSDVLLIGIDSDLLFFPHEVRESMYSMRNAKYKEISSIYGHDAFLIEYKQLEDIIFDYLYQVDEKYLLKSEKHE